MIAPRVLLLTLISVGILILPSPVHAASSRNLDRVQKDLRKAKRELYRYQDLEVSLKADIDSIDVRAAKGREKAEKLQKSLSKTVSKRKDLARRLRSLRTASGFWRGSLLEEWRDYAVFLAQGPRPGGAVDSWEGVFRRSALAGKGVWIKRIDGLKGQTGPALERSKRLQKSLEGRRREVRKERDRLRRSGRDKKAALAKTKTKTGRARKRIKELEKTSRELSRLLGRHRKRKGLPAVRLRIPRNSLPWPVSGDVAARFGKSVDPELGTVILHHGIEIKAVRNERVRAVARGKVIFAGPFRSYGRVIIVDHISFFSVYGRLGAFLKKKGASVPAGEAIAETGEGPVYFEIRSGAKPLDPLHWLRKRRGR